MAPNQPRPTKAQRREAARAQAKAAREKQLRQERRRTITRRSLIGVAGLAAAGTVGYVVYDYFQDRPPSEFPAPGTVPTVKADRQGVPEPVLFDGSWTYGPASRLDTVSPDAPVLDIFFDYACHHCANFELAHEEEISTLLAEGRITLVLHSAKLLGEEWTDQAMNAMGVVLSRAPQQSLAFHNALMKNLADAYEAGDRSLLSTENIVTAASSVKVPTDVSDELAKAIEDNTYEPWLELGQEAMKAAGVQQTPTIFLDGRKLSVENLQSETAITEEVDRLGSSGGTATGSAGSDDAAGDGQTPAPSSEQSGGEQDPAQGEQPQE